ncbi:MAG: hypothetical protein ACYSTZ_08905, partial [Planctomycetota bacterium]
VETERLIVALRVDVGARRLKAIPEMVRRGRPGAECVCARHQYPACGCRRSAEKPAATDSLL